jgi:hypothetical protein
MSIDNRVSVIVSPINRPSVIVFNHNNYDNDDIQIVYDNLIDSYVGENIDSSDDNGGEFYDNDFDNISDVESELNDDDHYMFDNDDAVSNHGNDYDEAFNIEDYFDLELSSQTNSKKFGVLFTHFKALINPNVYKDSKLDYLKTFSALFQAILNAIMTEVDAEFPDMFESVKVCLVSDEGNVNLNFLPLSHVVSNIFIMELYRYLQSKRDVVTSKTFELSFTFLPKLPNSS